MRLITLSKIYRAFPELDEFSDADCEAWVAAARRQIRWTLLLSTLFIGLMGAGLAVLLMWETLWRLVWGDTGRIPLLIQVFLCIGTPLLSGCIPAYLVRDALLRKKIRKQVLRTQCADCGFSLLGLPTTDIAGVVTVRCPECGVVRSLKGMNLTKEQLLSGVRSQTHEELC